MASLADGKDALDTQLNAFEENTEVRELVLKMRLVCKIRSLSNDAEFFQRVRRADAEY